jgi:hypothetical protein
MNSTQLKGDPRACRYSRLAACAIGRGHGWAFGVAANANRDRTVPSVRRRPRRRIAAIERSNRGSSASPYPLVRALAEGAGVLLEGKVDGQSAGDREFTHR